jgi:hypothetical protein
MTKSMKRGSSDTKNQNTVETVSDGLRKIYKQKLFPLEDYYRFHEFHSPALGKLCNHLIKLINIQKDDPDFTANPMILLVGQYSTGKTVRIL